MSERLGLSSGVSSNFRRLVKELVREVKGGSADDGQSGHADRPLSSSQVDYFPTLFMGLEGERPKQIKRGDDIFHRIGHINITNLEGIQVHILTLEGEVLRLPDQPILDDDEVRILADLISV